jgi:hypothetical protein
MVLVEAGVMLDLCCRSAANCASMKCNEAQAQHCSASAVTVLLPAPQNQQPTTTCLSHNNN